MPRAARARDGPARPPRPGRRTASRARALRRPGPSGRPARSRRRRSTAALARDERAAQRAVEARPPSELHASMPSPEQHDDLGIEEVDDAGERAAERCARRAAKISRASSLPLSASGAQLVDALVGADEPDRAGVVRRAPPARRSPRGSRGCRTGRAGRLRARACGRGRRRRPARPRTIAPSAMSPAPTPFPTVTTRKFWLSTPLAEQPLGHAQRVHVVLDDDRQLRGRDAAARRAAPGSSRAAWSRRRRRPAASTVPGKTDADSEDPARSPSPR